jgi:diguanylate cyclase (GGDEF)-like protein
MQKPAFPDNEALRLAELERLHLFNSPAESRFDRITRIAARAFATPIALVSVVAADCQWFKSRHGLAAGQTSRDISFCGHAILNDEVFVVEDALADPRFADNPLVVGEPHIRFYAGAPVRTVSGLPLGTLCVIDKVPRHFDKEDRDLLRDLADIVESELRIDRLTAGQHELVEMLGEAQRRALLDPLTGAWNRAGMEALLDRETLRARHDKHALGVMMIDVDFFKHINDQYGHLAGDAVLAEVANRLRQQLRGDDMLTRFGGDEFVVLVSDASVSGMNRLAERIRDTINRQPVEVKSVGEVVISTSIGMGLIEPPDFSARKALDHADESMYRAKRAGRNGFCLLDD